MQRFQAYFWDFDGTIGETGQDIHDAWLAAIDKLKLQKNNFDCTFRIGPSIQETSKLLYPDMSSAEREVLQETYKFFYDEAESYTARVYPGITETLNQLHRENRKIYIVTNKRLKPTLKLVRKFAISTVCDGIFVPDIIDPGNHMTKPQILALALRVSGVFPKDALMIGDTELDINAGKLNNIASCGVTWGYGSRECLTGSAPDYLISHPAQLLDEIPLP